MTLSLTLDYYTRWGESLALQLETAQGQSLHPLHTTDGRLWQLELELASTSLRYHFVLLGAAGEVLRREAGPSTGARGGYGYPALPTQLLA